MKSLDLKKADNRQTLYCNFVFIDIRNLSPTKQKKPFIQHFASLHWLLLVVVATGQVVDSPSGTVI